MVAVVCASGYSTKLEFWNDPTECSAIPDLVFTGVNALGLTLTVIALTLCAVALNRKRGTDARNVLFCEVFGLTAAAGSWTCRLFFGVRLIDQSALLFVFELLMHSVAPLGHFVFFYQWFRATTLSRLTTGAREMADRQKQRGYIHSVGMISINCIFLGGILLTPPDAVPSLALYFLVLGFVGGPFYIGFFMSCMREVVKVLGDTPLSDSNSKTLARKIKRFYNACLLIIPMYVSLCGATALWNREFASLSVPLISYTYCNVAIMIAAFYFKQSKSGNRASASGRTATSKVTAAGRVTGGATAATARGGAAIAGGRQGSTSRRPPPAAAWASEGGDGGGVAATAAAAATASGGSGERKGGAAAAAVAGSS